MKKNLWIKKKSCQAWAAVLSVGLLALTALAVMAEGPDTWDFPLLLFLSVAAGLYLLLNVKFGWILNLLSVAAIPFLSMWLLQWFTCKPERMYPMMILLNCIFFYLFYLGLSFLLGSFRLGYSISTVFTLILGIANYFVVEFRSSPIVPWDLLSIGTAASVADNYTYTVSWHFLSVVMGFVYVMLTAVKMTLKPKKWKLRVPAFAMCLALLLFTGVSIQDESVKDFFGMDQTLFTPNVRYRNNGFVAAFVGNLHLIHIKEPDGYSAEKVTEVASASVGESNGSDTAAVSSSAAGTELPNIIVVMDEAFSDLSVLGDFQTNEDYMPFFRSMMEEYTSGHLMVSVKGGNTANTEYEFLSGDSMAFLPSGSVVYQQYIKDEVPSLPTYLKSLGYSTTAIHPYLASGWDRDTVYPKLGFDSFLDIKSFTDAEYVRDYVSDESAFDKIIEVFENKEAGEKQFIFEVTMQNHSGYSKDYPGFSPTIQLTDFTKTSTSIQAAEKYLTLIKMSDTAFQKLIAYFEQVDEPTVIIMFGDHQPSDYITNVISRITGYDSEASLEEYQRSYLVPYVIWNNFGMEKDTSMELTSVNYLSSYLLKSLGLPLTEYQEFLLQLQEQLPVVCAGTYIDTDGVYHSWSEEDEVYEEILNNYNILQYNHLIDRKHRVSEVFGEPVSVP